MTENQQLLKLMGKTNKPEYNFLIVVQRIFGNAYEI